LPDTVDTKVIHNGRRYAVHCTNVSDSTGESAVAKIDISTLTNPNGKVCTSFTIDRIEYNIQGFTSVRLFWDHTTDDEIAVLPAGAGVLDWSVLGGKADPASSGGTGDVLLTTAGAVSGATYDLTIIGRPKA
jgi:hypothetical protein